jgi:hypothetical protein
MVPFQNQQQDLDLFPEWDAPVGSWSIYLPVSKVYYFVATEEEAHAFVKEYQEYQRHLSRTARAAA